MTADPQVGIDFLKQFRSSGPWVLTAIEPDGGTIITETFGPSSEGDLRAFIERYDGKRNIYYSLRYRLQLAKALGRFERFLALRGGLLAFFSAPKLEAEHEDT